jgi:small-conductance mechanosensitive channel
MKCGFIFSLLLLVFLPCASAQESVQDDIAADTAVEAPLPEPAEELAESQEPPAPEEAIADKVPAGIAAVESKITDRRLGFPARLGIAFAILALQALLIWLVWQKLFKWLSRKVAASAGDKIKPLTIKKLKLLSVRQIVSVIEALLRISKYLLTALQLFLTVPIVFSLFPSTRSLAFTFFGYILRPLQNIVIGAIRYIPNLIFIIMIIVITRYALKILKFFATQIAREKLVLHGFYPEWAEPTYKILHILLLAFTFAIIYPYLPGSDSKIFQGISVFVFIIFSLGSSSAIGNLVAGLVITYMRPFKIGDRVQIKEITGFVVEKNLMVVRLRTHKNEYVTFPNLTILGSSVTNYNTSTDEDAEGLILYTEVTFGYATPWQTVHEILINAALATEHVLKTPKPFVLQTGLDDFYARYQINCYTKEVDMVPKIYAQLRENIQNGFTKAGLDMTAPHYEVSAVTKV